MTMHLANENMGGFFQIHWNLINSCNMDCDFCDQRGPANFILVRDRLKTIADKILALPLENPHIKLAGGEPTLHPFLDKLLDYLLAGRPDSYISLATNASKSVDYFRELASPDVRARIAIDVHIHPGRTDMEAAASLVGQLGALGHPVRLCLGEDAQRHSDFIALFRSFALLRQQAPFALDLDKGAGVFSRQDLDALSGLFHVQAQRGPILNTCGHPIFAHAPQMPRARDLANAFCCAGAGGIHIHADGTWLLEESRAEGSQPPLWREGSLISALRPLKYIPGQRDNLPQPFFPTFSSEREAVAFLGGQISSERRPLSKSDSALFPGQPGFSLSHAALKSGEHVSFWRENAELIDNIYKMFADEAEGRFFTAVLDALGADGRFVSGDLDKPDICPGELESGGNVSSEMDSRPVFPWSGSGAFANYCERGIAEEGMIAAELPLDAPLLLDALGFLARSAPGCRLRLFTSSVNRDVLIVRACSTTLRALPRAVITLEGVAPPRLSIALLARGDSGDLSQAIDSLLMAENSASFEILIFLLSRSSSARKTAESYSRLYPGKVRYFTCAGQNGQANARIMALNMANGQYLTFLDDWLHVPCDFVSRALTLTTIFDTDIIIASSIPNLGGSNACACLCGPDDIVDLLVENSSALVSVSGMLFRLSALAGILQTVNDEEPFSSLQFMALALAGASSALVAPEPIISPAPRHAQSSLPETGFDGFCDIIRLIERLRGKYPRFQRACIPILKEAFARARADICAHVRLDDKSAALPAFLNPRNLFTLGGSLDALSVVIADYAGMNARYRNSWHSVDEAETSWNDAPPPPSRLYSSYGAAEITPLRMPTLSVIMANYNKANYLPGAIESVLSQSFADFELIIFDDASTDDSFGLLLELADRDARIRLYRMDENNRQGVCRNLAIAKARGEFLLFVDSDDLVEPGFFERGLQAVRQAGADIGLFSCQNRTLAGKVETSYAAQNEDFDGETGLLKYLNSEYRVGPVAKIFRTSTVLASGAAFGEHIFQEDHFFIASIMPFARKVASRGIMAYTARLTEDSSLRPTTYKYVHIHSACKFFNFLDQITQAGRQKTGAAIRHVKSNLENIYLHAWQAYFSRDGILALRKEDHKFLARNQVFLLGLLHGLAALARKTGQQRALMQTCEAALPIRGRILSPALSIILPAYNAAGSIKPLLEKLAPRGDSWFELIIVDDASIDDTESVCAAQAWRKPWISVTRNEIHAGRSASVTKALELAKGEYAVVINTTDDLSEPALARALAALRQHPGAEIYIRCGDNASGLPDGPLLGMYAGREALARICGASEKCRMGMFIFRKSLANEKIAFAPYGVSDAFAVLAVCAQSKYALLDVYPKCRGQVIHQNAISVNRQWWLDLCAYMELADRIGDECPEALEQFGSKWYVNNPRKIFAAFPDMPLSGLEILAASSGGANHLFEWALEDYANLVFDLEKRQPAIPWEDLDSMVDQNFPAPRLVEAPGFKLSECEPLFSIIMPLANADRAASETIASILRQKFAGLEILVVAQNPNDLELIGFSQKLASQDARIRVYYPTFALNAGESRNLALPLARGRYIMFASGGCRVQAGFFERAGNLLVDRCLDICVCGRAEGGESGVFPWKASLSSASGAILLAEMLNQQDKRIFVDGLIFQTDFLKQNNIKFAEFASGDILFLVHAFLVARTAGAANLLSITYESGLIQPRPVVMGRKTFGKLLAAIHKIYEIVADKLDTMPVGFVELAAEEQINFLANLKDYLVNYKKFGLPQYLSQALVSDLWRPSALPQIWFNDYINLLKQLQQSDALTFDEVASK